MKEIHKYSSQKIYLDIYGGSADALPTAAYTNDDGVTRSLTVVQDTPPTGIDDRYHVTLTMADTQNEGDIKINWLFEMDSIPVAKTDAFSVVTPYLSIAEVKDVWNEASDQDAIDIESKVRHIIHALTGQMFGYYDGVKKVRGSDSTTLMLPERLIELRTVNGFDADPTFTVSAEGWVLNYYPLGVPPVKADYYGLHMHTGGVIHNPNNVRLGEFYRAQSYEIEGVWGWADVPAAIREVTKILVNDYACADAEYRNRYLTSMTAADWRIQFNSGAFVSTGNVQADQLLKDYVLKRGWAVI